MSTDYWSGAVSADHCGQNSVIPEILSASHQLKGVELVRLTTFQLGTTSPGVHDSV